MSGPAPRVVITGASSGIGAATAIAFARDGARLVLGARGEAGLEDVARRCREVGGIADIRVVGSSGDDSLDRRAVAKLRRADPLPAGPEEARARNHVAVVSVAERIVTPARRSGPADHRTLVTA